MLSLHTKKSDDVEKRKREKRKKKGIKEGSCEREIQRDYLKEITRIDRQSLLMQREVGLL